LNRPKNVEMFERIREEYETKGTSFRKLSAAYGIPRSTIHSRATKEEWTRPKKEKDAPAQTIQPQTMQDADGILGDVAVRKIDEIVTELSSHYSSVDEPLVMSYAFDYQRMIRLEEIVQSEGETCISPKTGAPYMNPNFSALQAVKSSLAKTAQQLGLSIAARKRIGITLGQETETQSLFDFVEALVVDSDEEDVAV